MRRCLAIMVSLMTGFFSSCSIKEERSGCPCWLEVYCPDVPQNGIVLSAWSSGNVFSEKMKSGVNGCCYEREVPRRMLEIGSCLDNGSVAGGEKEYRIHPGCQADSLYSSGRTIDCTGDFAVDTVVLYKQFATVYLYFQNIDGGFPCDVRVNGNVSGINLASSEPLPGFFEYRPPVLEEEASVFRLPRQKDDSLAMELIGPDDGKVMETIPLGKLISETGYSWKSLDLNDIVISVDCSGETASVKVAEWDPKDAVEVII